MELIELTKTQYDNLMADRRRLDWLQANKGQVNWTTGSEPHLPHTSTPKIRGATGETVRDAIDQAMFSSA